MISEEDVKKVAKLARIHLSDEETKQHTKHLEAILEYVEKLNELDVTNVKPTSHAVSVENVYHEDIVEPSLTEKDIAQMAVDYKDGAFKVPKVIE